MSEAVRRVRAYLRATKAAYPDLDPDDSLDRVVVGGEIHDLKYGDLCEVLESAEIYEDLRNS